MVERLPFDPVPKFYRAITLLQFGQRSPGKSRFARCDCFGDLPVEEVDEIGPDMLVSLQYLTNRNATLDGVLAVFAFAPLGKRISTPTVEPGRHGNPTIR
jgi:hypothetical protein